MFCPDGFTSFRALYDHWQVELKSWAVDQFQCELNDAVDFSKGPKNLMNILNCRLPSDIVEEELFVKRGKDVWISSPLGQVMKFDLTGPIGMYASPDLLWSQIAFDLQGHSRELNDLNRVRVSSEAYGLSRSQIDQRLNEMDADNIDTDYLYSCLEFCHLAGRHNTVSHFIDRETFTISCHSFDWVVNEMEYPRFQHFQHAAKLFRQFEGWSLCVKDNVMRECETIARAYCMNADGGVSKKGRKRGKRDELKRHFERLYPEGRGNDALKVVAMKIRQETDTEFSDDTLQRAMNEASSEGG